MHTNVPIYLIYYIQFALGYVTNLKLEALNRLVCSRFFDMGDYVGYKCVGFILIRYNTVLH